MTSSATVSAAVAAVLCVGAVTLVLDERIMGTRLAAGVQAWMSGSSCRPALR